MTRRRPRSKRSRRSMTTRSSGSTPSTRIASRSCSAATNWRRACSRWSRCSTRSSGGPKGMKEGGALSGQAPPGLDRADWRKLAVVEEKAQDAREAIKAQDDDAIKRINAKYEDRVEKLQRGDELAPGVLKMVKVFVAIKRKLQSGDKMAGRHGNKGIISRILPIEDMPFLEDGTRSEEHTSELQSIMRISYAVFCLKKKRHK